jgi:hypothetical protein
MTRNSSTRSNIFRTAFQVIATLALAVSLVACGDSVSGPTSNPTTNSGGGTTGSGSGNNGNGTGNGGTTAGTNSVSFSGNGGNFKLDMGYCYALYSYSALSTISSVSINLSGTYNGRKFSISLLNTNLNNGSGVGRFPWNSSVGTAAMTVGWTTWMGMNGETVVTSFDRLDGRVRGTFKGMFVESVDNANKLEVTGSFDLQVAI